MRVNKHIYLHVLSFTQFYILIAIMWPCQAVSMCVLRQILMIALAQFVSLNFTVNLNSLLSPIVCSLSVLMHACGYVSACELVYVRLKSFKHMLLYSESGTCSYPWPGFPCVNSL